jgi:putative phosphoribosyl transferase
MSFRDRQDAGRQLAKLLTKYANHEDVLVLGIPRGGVPVAFEIATALHAPLDIFLSRKLGVPGQEELAFGAVAAGDGHFLDYEIIQTAGISPAQVEQITQATRVKLEERARLYRGDRPPISVQGRTVILVDDGIATGASVYAAIHALRQMRPKKLIVAAPVAPIPTINWLRSSVEELVVADSPEHFYAVGQFYDHFSQTTDEEVVTLLRRASRAPVLKTARPNAQSADPPADISQREVTIPVGNIVLQGTLAIPQGAQAIVLFVHGSGSNRYSPRNRHVAQVLHTRGLATLLVDLLTKEEEAVDRRTAELRFNIALLAKRLTGATEWIRANQNTSKLALGYFGASTGAAAALVAAARFPRIVDAVVSRGGRPDLARESLITVQAPTLLIVGGLDDVVITLNRQALDVLKCPIKRMAIVPNATHLFEEPGTLEEAARMAAEWFVHYLVPAGNNETNVAGNVASTAATHE